MKKMISFIFLVMVPLILAPRCQDSDGYLKAGVWGGEHWEMTVYEDATAFIQGDCAHGEVTEPIESVDGNVSFKFDLYSDLPIENPFPTTVEGTLKGDTLEATITVEDDSSPFVVTLGEEAVIFHCQ